MIFDKAFRKVRNVVINDSSFGFGSSLNFLNLESLQSKSMKLSAVNSCVETISNSMSKLPYYAIDSNTKQRVPHPIIDLLEKRPNEAMTPSVFKKYMEVQRLQWGNANAVIYRNQFGKPVELLLLPPGSVKPFTDKNGRLWFGYTSPKTGERRKFMPSEIVHVIAYSEDGVNGISVLKRAADVIETATAAQTYEKKLYTQNAQPSGVLKVSSELDKAAKDKMREEWARVHSGVDNAFRIAVLDLGLEYQQISISNKDAQFVESKGVSIEDISRFYNMPLYKLNAGKQSYSSNEQNAIEYVVNTLHPTCTQYEQEISYKGLFESELSRGIEIKINIMAELKGDFATRGKWYTEMRNNGSFSVNDILALEDRPKVNGGDDRLASLNYVPLDLFRELSIKRNENGGENG